MKSPLDRNLLYLMEIVRNAPTDKQAEKDLRHFVALASEKAPMCELVKLGETMVENLKLFRKENADKN